MKTGSSRGTSKPLGVHHRKSVCTLGQICTVNVVATDHACDTIYDTTFSCAMGPSIAHLPPQDRRIHVRLCLVLGRRLEL